ncbi:MAG: hypothetical protein JO026_00270 [Patescibacteria group bacterium]|nr:hypothetical protein [Patescibacteria group bacterium]
MEYAYIASNALTFLIWLILYFRRPDLRNMMIVASLCALPLALFDLIFVPTYWKPVTLFNIPIGIEGFLYSFSVGGIAAGLYPTWSGRNLQPIATKHLPTLHTISILLLTLVTFLLVCTIGVNPVIAAYVAITLGVACTVFTRKDLFRSAIFDALYFGIVYFIFLKLWVTIFPDVHSWFTFQGLPQFFIWSVPGWEALYGFFFGAFWANIYELLFGFRFVRPSDALKS